MHPNASLIDEGLAFVANLGWSHSREEFFQALVAFLGTRLGVRAVFVNERIGANRARTVGVWGIDGPDAVGAEFDLAGTPCEHVFHDRACYFASGLRAAYPDSPLVRSLGVDTYLGIPLWNSRGEVSGLVALLHDGPLEAPDLAEALLRVVAVRGAHELERRADQRELQAANAAVARLASAVTQADDGFLVADANRVIEFANPALSRLCRCPFGELVGRSVDDVAAMQGPAGLFAALCAPIGLDEPWRGRVSHRRVDGSTVFADATVSPVRDETGRIAAWACSLREVTREVLLQAQLVEANRLEAIGMLAGGVAHDFNNVLAVIIGSAELAKATLPGDSPALPDVHTIAEAARRASQLVRQVLTFSREARDPQEPSVLDATPLIHETLRFLRASLPATVHISHRVDRDLWLQGTPSAVNRVLMNLCANAAGAMPRGGELHVDALRVEQSGQPQLRLAVRDNGIGMSPDVQARIFDPFFTARPDGRGTGLGLSVVRGLVEGMGGQVTFASREGEGSEFVVLWPIAAQAGADDVTEMLPPPEGHERVLIVDDEPLVLQLYRRALSRFGFRVRVAERPQQVLDALRAAPMAYDILLTDLIMPEMTGDVLAVRARALRPDLPILLCTARPDLLAVDRLDEIGVTAILEKPVSALELGWQIRRAIDAAAVIG